MLAEYLYPPLRTEGDEFLLCSLQQELFHGQMSCSSLGCTTRQIWAPANSVIMRVAVAFERKDFSGTRSVGIDCLPQTEYRMKYLLGTLGPVRAQPSRPSPHLNTSACFSYSYFVSASIIIWQISLSRRSRSSRVHDVTYARCSPFIF